MERNDMLELGGKPQAGGNAAAPGDLIKDATEATFMADVIEASQRGARHRRFLGAVVRAVQDARPGAGGAVTAAKGKVRMVKVNVDENQRIAAQLRIQSIPTVYAFWQGQPVDGFQGALPGSEIKAFVDKLAALAGDGGRRPGRGARGRRGDADRGRRGRGRADLRRDPGRGARECRRLWRAGARPSRARPARPGRGDAGRRPRRHRHAPEVEAARAQLDLARQAAAPARSTELRAKVEADPNDHQARFDLAQALHAAGQVEEAVDELLELFRRDREWNDGAAKTQLFTIFDALKPQDPIVLKGRRRSAR
jgi:putative thioredoxin